MSAGMMEYLQSRGVTFLVIPHAGDDVVTADAGIPSAGGVVRTEVLVTALGHALLVVADDADVDLELARAAVRDPQARLAGAEELERAFPDYEPGALPPLGLFFLAPMYVDPSVAALDAVVFRAGTRSVSIAMSTQALFRDDPVVITPLTSVATDLHAR